jgi:catechol 2,3-dioxygenase-like lactoylglutathione lyase family enzyme
MFVNKLTTYGLTHLAVAVKDIERTLQFYQDIFGMEVMYHEPKMIQLTTPGSHDILVFEETSGPTGQSGGIAHFGFRLRTPGDIDEILERVRSSGAEIVDQGHFVEGSPYVFFKDPDGYIIEVWFEAEMV